MATDAYKDAQRTRFETDLEFVQCLANPFYLQTLAQQGTLADPSFQNYLLHLEYFRQSRYSKFIQYPQCLHHLELLIKSQSFREALMHDATIGELAKIQVEHWKTWRERLEDGVSPEEEGKAATEEDKKQEEANGQADSVPVQAESSKSS